MNLETITRRVLAEFEESPGMALTAQQASRLFGLDHDFCRVVLDVLVDSAYLREIPGGRIALGERVLAY